MVTGNNGPWNMGEASAEADGSCHSHSLTPDATLHNIPTFFFSLVEPDDRPSPTPMYLSCLLECVPSANWHAGQEHGWDFSWAVSSRHICRDGMERKHVLSTLYARCVCGLGERGTPKKKYGSLVKPGGGSRLFAIAITCQGVILK